MNRQRVKWSGRKRPSRLDCGRPAECRRVHVLWKPDERWTRTTVVARRRLLTSSSPLTEPPPQPPRRLLSGGGFVSYYGAVRGGLFPGVASTGRLIVRREPLQQEFLQQIVYCTGADRERGVLCRQLKAVPTLRWIIQV